MPPSYSTHEGAHAAGRRAGAAPPVRGEQGNQDVTADGPIAGDDTTSATLPGPAGLWLDMTADTNNTWRYAVGCMPTTHCIVFCSQ